MQATITTIEQLKKGNPRLCLSAKRPSGSCWKCKQYDSCESKIPNENFDQDAKDMSFVRLEYQKKVRAFHQRWPRD